MDRINLADAQEYFSEIVDRVEAGETLDITRRGKPIVRLSPLDQPKRKVDIAALRKLHEGQTMQNVSAGDFVRTMRDTDRF